jgi:hypothetical protein
MTLEEISIEEEDDIFSVAIKRNQQTNKDQTDFSIIQLFKDSSLFYQ